MTDAVDSELVSALGLQCCSKNVDYLNYCFKTTLSDGAVVPPFEIGVQQMAILFSPSCLPTQVHD